MKVTGNGLMNAERETVLERGQVFESVDSEKFFEELLPLVMDEETKLSPFDVLKRHFKFVCPHGLLTSELAGLVEMEAFCREYSVPPLGSEAGYLEYPMRMVDAFRTISIVRERLNAKDRKAMTENAGSAGKG